MSKATDRFEAASKEVKKQLIKRQGGQAAENNYSSTYQDLVKAGEAPQIRKKYRTAKTGKTVRK